MDKQQLKQTLEEWAHLLRNATIQKARRSYYEEDSAASGYTCMPQYDKAIKACAFGVYGIAHKMSEMGIAMVAHEMPSHIQANVFHMNDDTEADFKEIADYVQQEADKL